MDADKFNEGTEFVITSGGYCSEEEAFAFSAKVKESVLCFGTKFRMGVDIGKDKANIFTGKTIKDEMLKDYGVRILDDVHGISVFDEEHPVSFASGSSPRLFMSREKNFFAEEVCKIILSPKTIDTKNRLSMELLTASYFEPSPRSRFLTLILAAEALLAPDERSDKVKLLVDKLRKNAESSDISDEEKKSILGSLNWLYKDSISQSLRKMATTHLADREYGRLPANKFIATCYDARSKLVHTGGVDESKFDIGSLAANLEVYLTQMLTRLAGL